MSINHGLARLDICPYIASAFDTIPQVFITPEVEWDPQMFDHDSKEQWEDTMNNDLSPNLLLDVYGNYSKHIRVQPMSYFQHQYGDDLMDNIDQCVFHSKTHCWDKDNPVFYNSYDYAFAIHIPPAVDNGSTLDVLFVGKTHHRSDVYGIKHDKKFVNNLEDNIIQPGTPQQAY